MIIGSHVSMSAPDYVLGAVKEAISYHANAFMLYTGAPQNTVRKDIHTLHIEEALQLMKEQGISNRHMIVHAPYIINLANCTKPETFQLGVRCLRDEIARTKAMSSTTLVLHPGSHVLASKEAGLDQIVEGLNQSMSEVGEVIIALETMAGKGSELGIYFEELRYIIDHCKYGDSLGVCMDTCHLHDAGYDLTNFDAILEAFDQVIGLDRLACIHINDSKNVRGAHKDRHANIGFGEIGFTTLANIVHHPKLSSVVKILETPYVDGHAPYRHEIEMLKAKQFDESLLDHIKES